MENSSPNPVPAHYHKDYRIEAKDLIPNPDNVSVIPNYPAPEGSEVVYLNGSDFRVYRMIDGAWHQIGASGATKVRVHLAVNHTAIGTQQVLFDTVDFDTNSEFNTTTHQFTAKTAGYYQVYASVYFSGSVTNQQYATKIYKNGTEISESNKIRVNASDDPFTVPVSDIVSLAVGDTVDIQAYTNAASSVTINNGTTITYLTIHSL